MSKSKGDIYTRTLKPKGEVNQSLFSFLFIEIVHYVMKSKPGMNIDEIEQSLKDFARPMGP